MTCELCNRCRVGNPFDGQYYCYTHKIYFRFFIGRSSKYICFKYKEYYIEIWENLIYIQDFAMGTNKFKLKIPRMDNNLFLESIEGILLLS